MVSCIIGSRDFKINTKPQSLFEKGIIQYISDRKTNNRRIELERVKAKLEQNNEVNPS